MKYSKSYRTMKDVELREKRIEKHLKIMAISLAVSAVMIFIVSNI